MSLLDAMQSGTLGLNANSRRLNALAANISNSSTTGYKRTFTEFLSTGSMSGTPVLPQTVRAMDRSTVGQQGALRPTGRNTDLAISGEGFFVVSGQTHPKSNRDFSLTRVGSFRMDGQGFLRNTAGLVLFGFPLDRSGRTNVVDQSSFIDLQPVRLPKASTFATPTTRVIVAGNLPAQAARAEALLPFHTSMQFHDQLGKADDIKITWMPLTSSTWRLAIGVGDGPALGTVEVEFHDSGPLAGTVRKWEQTAVTTVSPSSLAFDEGTGVAHLSLAREDSTQSVELSFGQPNSISGLTHFVGDFSVSKTGSDGGPSSSVAGFQFDEANGFVYGTARNGQRLPLFQVPLAVLNAPENLSLLEGNAYGLTRTSGGILLLPSGSSAGTIKTGFLEESNVDIAVELEGLIETQRAYSSNARIIVTVDAMLLETNNVIE